MVVAHEAPHSMGFSRQENCNGLLFPTPGDLPNPGIDPVSPASPVLQAFFFFYCWAIGEAPDRFFTAEPLGKPLLMKKNKTKQNKTKQNRIKFKTCFSEVLGWQKSSLESFGNIVWKPGGTLLPIQCFFFFFWERNGKPLQSSCLENPMDRGAWGTTIHGVAKTRTRLSHWTTTTTPTSAFLIFQWIWLHTDGISVWTVPSSCDRITSLRTIFASMTCFS